MATKIEEKIDFEKEEKRLQEIVSKLESDGLKLDEAVTLYKEGTALVKTLKAELDRLKNVVEDEIDD